MAKLHYFDDTATYIDTCAGRLVELDTTYLSKAVDVNDYTYIVENYEIIFHLQGTRDARI